MMVDREHPLRPGSVGLTVRLVLLVGLSVVTLLPMYWMFLSAFQPEALSMQFPPSFWPSDISFANFEKLFEWPDFFRWTLNSLIFAGIATALQVLTAAMAGYAFAKLKFPGSKFLFWLYIISMMLPFQVTLIPLFIVMSQMGLSDTYLGLILPAIASPFAVFLMKQMMQTIPSELLDAARMDGCTEMGVLRHVMLPLAKSAMAYLGIIGFVAQWNNFLWPLVITSSSEMRPLQVGLVLIQESEPLSYGLQMAGATYSAIPMILVFFIFQRQFLRGVTVGAVKG